MKRIKKHTQKKIKIKIVKKVTNIEQKIKNFRQKKRKIENKRKKQTNNEYEKHIFHNEEYGKESMVSNFFLTKYCNKFIGKFNMQINFTMHITQYRLSVTSINRYNCINTFLRENLIFNMCFVIVSIKLHNFVFFNFQINLMKEILKINKIVFSEILNNSFLPIRLWKTCNSFHFTL